MKRLTALILTLSLLLSGCGSASNPSAEPLSTLGPSIVKAEEKACGAPSELRRSMLHLLDAKIPVEGSDNLFEIPCPALAQLNLPTMVAYGEDLLFYAHDFDTDGTPLLTLSTVNHITGTCRTSKPYRTTVFFPPQILNAHISLCDPDSGRIVTLTQTLDTDQEFSLPVGNGVWYLSSDQNTLYELDWDGNIHATSLQDTSQIQVIKTLSHHSYFQPDNERVPLTYADPATQRASTGYLDLTDGTIAQAPLGSNCLDLTVSSDCWLGSDFDHTAPVYFYDGTSKQVITTEEEEAIYLVDPGMLVKLNADRTQLSLYDETGTHLSTCTIPPLMLHDTPSIVWSPSYGGYFLLCNDANGKGTLLFWDTGTAMEGDPLPMCSYEEFLNTPAGTMLDSALYARAKDLGDRYGLEICIGDQCETDYPSFTASQVTTPEDIADALDQLEDALAAYPEGFFQQLCYDTIQQVEISLMTNLLPGDGYQGSYNGFAFSRDDEYQIVVDIYTIAETTYFHEISHIIDSRLNWDTEFRPDALFSEEHWKSLSPESFSYTFSYDAVWPNIYGNGLDSYFIDGYSCTYPTEDRARVMETAMGDEGEWTFTEHEALREKLSYYCDCIRDCFDTTGWPETTRWETYLHTP